MNQVLCTKKAQKEAGERAQLLRTLAAVPEDLGSVCSTHVTVYDLYNEGSGASLCSCYGASNALLLTSMGMRQTHSTHMTKYPYR